MLSCFAIVLGITGDSPPGLTYEMMPLGKAQMIFAVAPHHPLASYDFVSLEDLQKAVGIVVRDTARVLTRRSSGIYEGQRILVVDSMQDKLHAHIQGLGVGYLPYYLAAPAIEKGLLVEKQVPTLKKEAIFSAAWRRDQTRGKAFDWWITQLRKPQVCVQLMQNASKVESI